MKGLILLALLCQVADPAAVVSDPPEVPKVDFTEYWKDQYDRGWAYDYPALNWDKIIVGQAGWSQSGEIYFGHRAMSYRYAEFEYVKQLDSGEHVIRVNTFARKVVGLGLSTSNPRQVGSLTGATTQTGSGTMYALVEGELPETTPGKIRFEHHLLVVRIDRLPGYGEVPVLKLVTFPERPTHRAQLGIDVRTFTDVTGKHKTEAVYEGFADGNVKLTKTDGKEISVPIKTLSDKDQRWVREQIREKLAADRKAEREARLESNQ